MDEEIDQLDADERCDDSAEAVDPQVSPQQRVGRCPESMGCWQNRRTGDGLELVRRGGVGTARLGTGDIAGDRARAAAREIAGDAAAMVAREARAGSERAAVTEAARLALAPIIVELHSSAFGLLDRILPTVPLPTPETEPSEPVAAVIASAR